MSDDNLFAQLDSGMSMKELGSSLLDRNLSLLMTAT